MVGLLCPYFQAVLTLLGDHVLPPRQSWMKMTEMMSRVMVREKKIQLEGNSRFPISGEDRADFVLAYSPCSAETRVLQGGGRQGKKSLGGRRTAQSATLLSPPQAPGSECCQGNMTITRVGTSWGESVSPKLLSTFPWLLPLLLFWAPVSVLMEQG